MFRVVVKLYLQLEKLWQNPAVWFASLPWALRMLTVIAFVPPIVISSLSWSSFLVPRMKQNHDLQVQTTQELLSLKEAWVEQSKQQQQDLEDIKKELAAVQKSLTVIELNNDLSKTVLGDQTASVPQATGSGQLVEIFNASGEKVAVYAKPSTTAQIIKNLDPNTFISFLSKKPGWYEVALNQDTTGWIQSEVVRELP